MAVEYNYSEDQNFPTCVFKVVSVKNVSKDQKKYGDYDMIVEVIKAKN